MKYFQSFNNFLFENYNQKIKNQLYKKFKAENLGLTLNIFNHYVDRFFQIKNSPKIKEKDIFKYSWKQLEEVVDKNQSKKIKVSKIKFDKSEEIKNNNGLKIYLAKNRDSCIRYGDGYTFCISNKNLKTNLFLSYKYEDESACNTFYFIFDPKKSKEIKDGEFIDPHHLIVLKVGIDPWFNKDEGDKIEDFINYTLTNANNDGDKDLNWDGIIKVQSKLKGLKEKLLPICSVDEREKLLYKLELEKDKKIEALDRVTGFDITKHTPSYHYEKLLNGSKRYVLLAKMKPDYEDFNSIGQIIFKNKSLEKFAKEQELNKDDIESFTIEELPPLNKDEIKYLKEIEKINLEYLHKVNLLNMK
jgi:hypothetical protein